MIAERPEDRNEASGRLLFVLALVAGIPLRLVLLGKTEIFGPDEGIWAVGARNVVEGGLSQVLALSGTPLGAASGTPFFFPLLLSVMVRVFGAEEWAIRLPSVFAGLVGAFVLERIVRRGYGQPAGHLAGAFAALFPPLVAASRTATVEPALVALGLGGVIFGIRAFEEDKPVEGVLAGLFFGLGFLAKGHAVGLFALPLAGALLVRPRLLRLGKTVLCGVVLVGTTVLVAGLPLGVLALARPDALGLHLREAFDLLPHGTPPWSEGTAFHADPRTIVKTLFIVLPLAGLGTAFLTRPRSESEVETGATDGQRRLSHGTLWTIYGLELLVVVAVAGRVQLSSIPVMPALAAFSGFGAAILVGPARQQERRAVEVRTALASGGFVLVLAIGLMALARAPLFDESLRVPIATGTAMALIVLMTLLGAFFAAGLGARALAGHLPVVVLGILLSSGGAEAIRTLARDLARHQSGAREAADQVAPLLAPERPEVPSFRAPDPMPIAFRLFRAGLPWTGRETIQDVEREALAGSVRCWIVRGRSTGSELPSAEVLSWLESSTREVTGEVAARAGHPIRLRVFVSTFGRPPA